MSPHSNKLLGIFLVTIAALSWSTAGLFTHVVTTDIPTPMFWRSLFGAITVGLGLGVYMERDNRYNIFEMSRTLIRSYGFWERLHPYGV